MKKSLILFAMLLISFCGFSQTIQSTKDCSKTQSELYSIVRMYISDKWNNPKNSISNEDKEAGLIQVNTEKDIIVKAGMGLKYVYTYKYRTRFRLKDNKYRIEIYDIECTNAEQVGLGDSMPIPLIPYFEGDKAPEKTKSLGKGVSKKKAIQMMEELRAEFEVIFNDFDAYLTSYNDDF